MFLKPCCERCTQQQNRTLLSYERNLQILANNTGMISDQLLSPSQLQFILVTTLLKLTLILYEAKICAYYNTISSIYQNASIA